MTQEGNIHREIETTNQRDGYRNMNFTVSEHEIWVGCWVVNGWQLSEWPLGALS